MGWQLTPFTLPLAVAVLLPFATAALAYRRTDQRATAFLIAFLLGAGIWCAAQALQLSSTTLGAKMFWYRSVFLGATIVPIAYFLLVAEFTGRRRWMRRSRIAALLAVEVLINAVVWTDPLHGLVLADTALVTAGSFAVLEVRFGPLFYVHALFQYLLVAVSVSWLVSGYWWSGRTHGDVYRRQAGLIVLAALLPACANVAFLAGVTAVELTPLAWAATSVVVVVALFRYQLLDITPIARDAVVESIDSGVLVFDEDDRIVDLNTRALELIEASRAELLGAPFAAVFGDFPSVLDRFGGARDARDRISITHDGERYHYDVRVSPITGPFDAYLGRAIVFSDVTAQVERERELERKNEYLDDFLGVVSHDIATPLGVIENNARLVEMTGDPSHAEDIFEATDRIQELIDDLLELARAGRWVGEIEPVEFEAIARRTWGSIDDPGATMTVESSTRLEANPDRLRQLLENLLRNAVEHGSTGGAAAPHAAEHGSTAGDLRVRVGTLPDGFYVADDGPGIPEADRGQVFDAGYSATDGGTGFGLNIVQRVADAHGWEIGVTESEAGGARFEITGVTTGV